jgi:hypothetical protein
MIEGLFVLAIVFGFCALIGSAIGLTEPGFRAWLFGIRCPYTFCGVNLPRYGAKNSHGDYVVEECPGCGQSLRFTEYGARYDRVIR